MPIYKCSKCYPTNVPDNLSDEQKSQIAFQVRELNAIKAMQDLKNSLNLSLTDSKNIVLHITRTKGLCHHCKNALSNNEGNCLKCGRLNLDW